MSSLIFSAEIYRNHSLDLREMSDVELERHFEVSQHESRIFGVAKTTAEFISMRWLRGSGLEVSAGAYPTPLFGKAKVLLADCDSQLLYGAHSLDVKVSIDDPEFPASFEKTFDFSIASHVLEHCDSFIRAIENMISVTKLGGIAYIVLPDIEFLHDKMWMTSFDFAHHICEYKDPSIFAKAHDRAYIEASSTGIDDPNQHASLSSEYRSAVKSGNIPD